MSREIDALNDDMVAAGVRKFVGGDSALQVVIKGVHLVPMGLANAFLIEGDDGLTLIDAGYPEQEAAVFAAIRRLGQSPDHLKHLIFTHGHPDHIGSGAAIVRKTGIMTIQLEDWRKVS